MQTEPLRIILMTMEDLTQEQADALADYPRLDPREITVGPHAGKYAVPAAVLDDPTHGGWLDLLRDLPIVEVDRYETWPPVDE